MISFRKFLTEKSRGGRLSTDDARKVLKEMSIYPVTDFDRDLYRVNLCCSPRKGFIGRSKKVKIGSSVYTTESYNREYYYPILIHFDVYLNKFIDFKSPSKEDIKAIEDICKKHQSKIINSIEDFLEDDADEKMWVFLVKNEGDVKRTLTELEKEVGDILHKSGIKKFFTFPREEENIGLGVLK